MRPQPWWIFALMGGAGIVRALSKHPNGWFDWAALASSIVLCSFAVAMFVQSKRSRR